MWSFQIPGWTETWNCKLPNKLIGEKITLKLLLNFKSTETTSCSVSNMISFKIFLAKTGTASTPSSLSIHSLQSRGHERIGFARDLVEEMSVKAKGGGTGKGKGGLSDHDVRGTPARGRERKRGRKEGGVGKNHLGPGALLSLAWCSLARLMGNSGAKVASRGLTRPVGTGQHEHPLCQSRVGRTWPRHEHSQGAEGQQPVLCVPIAPALGHMSSQPSQVLLQIILSLEMTLVFINPDRLWWNYASSQLNSQSR